MSTMMRQLSFAHLREDWYAPTLDRRSFFIRVRTLNSSADALQIGRVSALDDSIEISLKTHQEADCIG